ncbi:MAG: hypothetical protein OXB93_02665, partial [Cytophagales bacterium]|nr:hypothetical protein [Cytophagales bacterium]
NGGTYNYLHCTFTNYPSIFPRYHSSYSFLDHTEDSKDKNVLHLEILNSILWGPRGENISIKTMNSSSTVRVRYSLLRDYPSSLHHKTNLTSEETAFPQFSDVENHDYTLDLDSPLRDRAEKTDLSMDLDGNIRGDFPDIGAYEGL